MKKKTLWIAETAVMIALLVALQGLTKPAGQFVTGSCVNLILGVSTLVGGLWCGLTVALLSPFFAFLFGIGPALIQIVPAIAVGNIVLVLVLFALCRKAKKLSPLSYGGAAAASVCKFVALYALVVVLLLPLLGLPEKQVATMSAMFSWPQLVTALIGSFLAVTIAPVIRKALHR